MSGRPRQASVGGGDNRPRPIDGIDGRPDKRSLAEQMASFDALPPALRYAANYGPLPPNTEVLEVIVRRQGAAWATVHFAQMVAEAWALLGAEPLRP